MSFHEHSVSGRTRSTTTMCSDSGDETCLVSLSRDSRSNIEIEHTKNTRRKTKKSLLCQLDNGTCFFFVLFSLFCLVCFVFGLSLHELIDTNEAFLHCFVCLLGLLLISR